jgi:hypothetical protein
LASFKKILPNCPLETEPTAEEHGLAALQTANSRYMTALSLYDEWYQIAEDCGDSDEFRIWLMQRLNAEEPHCT